MHIKKFTMRGVTLTEMMIALALNAIIFTALLTVFMDQLKHYQNTINTNRLNEQLTSAMQYMANDIRRAGYWANANNDVGLGQNNNPFMTNATDVSVSNGNCILFSFDRSNDGAIPAISANYDDERYGFRLMNQTLQARPPGASFDCNASASNWENVTDPSIIVVTNLSFTLNSNTLTTGPGTRGIIIRSVDISITGRLVSDSSVTKTLTEHIRIRNDKFIP